MIVVENEKGTPKGLVAALSRDCPVCGAKAGVYCDDPEVPQELKPGWHTEREVQDGDEAKAEAN